MLLNIVIAAALILATTLIHAAGMMLALHRMHKPAGSVRNRLLRSHVYAVGEVIVLMFNVSLLEVILWALVFLALNATQGFEQSLYFSMVTYTTLGYGDVLLDARWRLLASFEAANGIIMFGWTTAIVMAVVHKVYFGSSENKPDVQADSGHEPLK